MVCILQSNSFWRQSPLSCFKGNPQCIDLILTNRKCYFKNTCVTETGISDFHKLTAVSLKSHILKSPAKVKHFRNYKSFDENAFDEDLKSRLDSTEKLEHPLFESIFMDVLNTHAPIKTKTVRANNHPLWRGEGAYLTKRFSPQCIKKWSSSERCSYVR